MKPSFISKTYDQTSIIPNFLFFFVEPIIITLTYWLLLLVIYTMFTQNCKFIDYASLISVLLLTPLHQFVIFLGHNYYSVIEDNIGIIYINNQNYSLRDFTVLAVFWEIAIALSSCISLSLILSIFTNKLTNKGRFILLLILLGLQFALSVSLASTVFTVSNRQQYLYFKIKVNRNKNLDTYANWLIINASITFLLSVIPIGIVCSGINLAKQQQMKFQI